MGVFYSSGSWIWNQTWVCVLVCVKKGACDSIHWNILLPVQGSQLQSRRAHTHTHTCVWHFTVQRTGKTNPSTSTCVTCWQGSADKFIMSAFSHVPDSKASVNITVQTDTVVSTFPREEWSETGKSRNLTLSHKSYTCTHDFNAHWYMRRLHHLCTHTTALTRSFIQTNLNIKCFKKYRLKKGKKALGKGLISGCLVKGEKR